MVFGQPVGATGVCEGLLLMLDLWCPRGALLLCRQSSPLWGTLTTTVPGLRSGTSQLDSLGLCPRDLQVSIQVLERVLETKGGGPLIWALRGEPGM